jgi:5-methyltetrahydropteroyltriglutamate--homocysteine methyltransferase
MAPPPFRAEHIGSLLRPASLLDMRAKYMRDEIDFAALEAATSAAIEDAIRLQESVGLQVVTVGEFRREAYHSYFFRQLGEISLDNPPDAHAAGRGAQPQATINTRLKWTKAIHVQDFEFLKARTKATPKITIPGPCALHFRGGNPAVLASAYDDMEAFWDDVVACYQAEFKALAAAGCTYVQVDETAFAKFGDPDVQASLAARGDDWNTLIDFYIDVTNRVLAGVPSSLTIGMHLCRGNRGGKWHAEGSYETVADRLFNKINVSAFFLEYDSPRAGNFTPLRLVPKDKHIILGLVSTKSEELEDKDALKRRIEDATKYVALDKLGVSPQCGFASVETGNPISPATQEAKLRRVVEVAQEVWG